MGRFISLIRKAMCHLGLVFCVLACARSAWAAGQSRVTEATEADWVFSYAVVMLCIGLAVFAVCRPGKRRADIRRTT